MGASVGTSKDNVGSSATSTVGLGSGVGLGGGVGGTAVALGTDCCVMATIVLAAATADAWIAAGSTVGVAGAQPAPAIIASAAIVVTRAFMQFSLSPGVSPQVARAETRITLRAE